MFISAQCLTKNKNKTWSDRQSVTNYLNLYLIMLCSFITFSTKWYFSAFKWFCAVAILLIVTFEAKKVTVKWRIIQFFSFIDNVKSFSPLFCNKRRSTLSTLGNVIVFLSFLRLSCLIADSVRKMLPWVWVGSSALRITYFIQRCLFPVVYIMIA